MIQSRSSSTGQFDCFHVLPLIKANSLKENSLKRPISRLNVGITIGLSPILPMQINMDTNSSIKVMNKGYIFKVSVKHIRPPIWRRIWVPEWLSLNEFHQVIQDVMGWYDCHLHSFETGGKEYGIPDEDFPDSTIDDTGVALKKVVRKVGQKIRYIYDFGDCWEHEILLEKKESSDSIYPYVLKGKRACPPEDCGSVPGYYRILEVLNKTNHTEEEKELLEWVGESYDPEGFDIEEVNEILKIGPGDGSDVDR